jgi:hypothetical protein
LVSDSINIIQVQLPFMLIYSWSYYFRIFDLKSWQLKPTIISVISSKVLFQSVLIIFRLSITLILSLSYQDIFHRSGAFNISTLFVPKQFSGISINHNLLFLVGMSIGRNFRNVHGQYRFNVDAVFGSYPSGEAYNLIFLTGALISCVSLLHW